MSDGAAAHFKNRYRFYELLNTDYVTAKWVFTATGHGKSGCDGVGGVVKHRATVHNLRATAGEAIRSASELVSALAPKLPNVHLIYLPADTISSFREDKKAEWESVRAVNGIQSSHVWESNMNDEGNRELFMARTCRSATRKVAIRA